MTSRWTEVGDRVLVRRYAFYDQDIACVLGADAALLVDTRSTAAQAREILDDMRDLGSPRVGIVVNTHGHYDHAFGNAVFRPAPVWGHERCRSMLLRFGESQRARAAAEVPVLAAGLAETVIDPPDHLFAETATLDIGGREVRLAYLGRGHTDNDIVVSIPDADVVCAGDLVENGATPWFGDGFPLDWPATAERLLAMTGPATVVVPGHGEPAGRTFVDGQLAGFRAVVAAARRVHAGELDVEAAMAAACEATDAAGTPWPAEAIREPIERALAQLRGELDR
jgi:glyoxylase-like metal-dependent hydrolase (beta-lactamase superfamily II)